LTYIFNGQEALPYKMTPLSHPSYYTSGLNYTFFLSLHPDCWGTNSKYFWKKKKPGLNFIKVLHTTFAHADPKSVKKTVKLLIFFTLLESTSVKAVRRMLMKLSPVRHKIRRRDQLWQKISKSISTKLGYYQKTFLSLLYLTIKNW